jgi:hypothetical protein
MTELQVVLSVPAVLTMALLALAVFSDEPERECHDTGFDPTREDRT